MLCLAGHLAGAESLETGLKRMPAPGPGGEWRNGREHARPDREAGHDLIYFPGVIGPNDEGETDSAAQRPASQNALLNNELLAEIERWQDVLLYEYQPLCYGHRAGGIGETHVHQVLHDACLLRHGMTTVIFYCGAKQPNNYVLDVLAQAAGQVRTSAIL